MCCLFCQPMYYYTEYSNTGPMGPVCLTQFVWHACRARDKHFFSYSSLIGGGGGGWARLLPLLSMYRV